MLPAVCDTYASTALQAHGVRLGLAELLVVAFTASLAAVGAPAIPSAGLVTMLIVLQAVSLDQYAAGGCLGVTCLRGRFVRGLGPQVVRSQGQLLGGLDTAATTPAAGSGQELLLFTTSTATCLAAQLLSFAHSRSPSLLAACDLPAPRSLVPQTWL